MLEEIAARGLLIGGEWVASTSRGSGVHVCPSSGKPTVKFPMAGAAEIDAAVAAARAGQATWAALPSSERSRLLQSLANRIEARAETWAQLGAYEVGMPIASGGGTHLALAWARYYAGWPDKIEGGVIPTTPGGLDYVALEPYGVVGVVMTWNSPLISAAMKAIPALAAGNSVVIKAAEHAPFMLLELGATAVEAGLPPGVVNVVTGNAQASEHLVAHPDVDKITFTGGGAVGRAVMQTAASRLAPVTLELGGKSPHLVFADADRDAAAAFALQWGVLALSGQGCANPTRLLVENSAYDEVTQRVVAGAEAVQLGDPFDPSTQMGPLISEEACNRVQGFVERAIEGGAGKLLTGGARLPREGWFFPPTVLGDVDPRSEIAQEEIFGPVLCMTRFRDEDDALALANGTRYGLSSYVFTRDIGRALRLARGLVAGNVHVNGHSMMTPNAPFGGARESGIGREGGRAGLEEFLRTKNVYVSLD